MLPSMLAAHMGMTDSDADDSKAPVAKGTGDAGAHLRNALAAHKKGDHKTAKKHALKAVNVLHRASAPAVPAAPAIPAVPSAA